MDTATEVPSISNTPPVLPPDDNATTLSTLSDWDVMAQWTADEWEQILDEFSMEGIDGLGLERLSDATKTRPETEWLWPGYIARGHLHFLVGEGGKGKSFAAMDFAARITAGLEWPDGAPALSTPKNVLYVATEDDAATIHARITGMGGDSSKVAVAKLDTVLSLQDRCKRLEEWIVQTRAVYIVLDPLSSFMGQLSSKDDTEVRTALDPLSAVLRRTNTALVFLKHVNKDTERAAMLRVLDSVAFTNVPRMGYFVCQPDTQQGNLSYLVQVKHNILLKASVTLAYRLADEGDRLKWEGEVPSFGKTELDGVLQGTTAKHQIKASGEQAKARAFLLDYLGDGIARLASEGKKAAKADGVKDWALAKELPALGIEQQRVPGLAETVWTWKLTPTAPKPAPPTPEDTKMLSCS